MSDMSIPDRSKRADSETPPAEDMPLPHDPQTIFLGGLFLLACLAAAYVAQEVILPIILALVLKLLLQPLVRQMERIHIPKALGAAVAILLLFGVIAVLGAILSSPATKLISNWHETWGKLQENVAPLKALVERAQAAMGGGGGDLSEQLSAQGGAIAKTVASGASSFASHLLETLLILFYLLVFSEVLMLRLVEILPRLTEKKQAVEISQTVEADISVYLLTITVINAVVGTLCGLMMWAFGVPGAAVWGVIAFCLNYVPILGPFTGVALFGVIGLATLGGSWFSVLPAVGYLAIHFLEGEMITPMLLARRFTLNPIAVMVALVFWYWMWGVQGAILSVPLLAIAKIVCDRLRPFRAFGHLLEG